MLTVNTYYVSAQPSGQFANCQYYIKTNSGFSPVDSPLYVPSTATACNFIQHPDSQLSLLAAVSKTIGSAATLTVGNYVTLDDDQVVAVKMPDDKTVSKSVILMFSTPSDVTQLFPSGDPIVRNDGA